MARHQHIISIILLASIALSGCASNGSAVPQQEAVVASTQASDQRDPIESFNRAMWTLNWDYLDTWVLRPVTKLYVAVAPQFVRTGLLNMMLNLEEPASIVNNLLQGRGTDAATTAVRFTVNSSIGLLGTIDVAKSMGLDRQDEEFGEVLEAYGVGQGPFLMLPIKGPADGRNMFGDAVDSSYLLLNALSTPANILRMGVVIVETRATLMSQESMLNNAIDPYSLVKDIYFQKETLKRTEHLSDEQLDAEMEEEFGDDIDALLDDL